MIRSAVFLRSSSVRRRLEHLEVALVAVPSFIAAATSRRGRGGARVGGAEPSISSFCFSAVAVIARSISLSARVAVPVLSFSAIAALRLSSVAVSRRPARLPDLRFSAVTFIATSISLSARVAVPSFIFSATALLRSAASPCRASQARPSDAPLGGGGQLLSISLSSRVAVLSFISLPCPRGLEQLLRASSPTSLPLPPPIANSASADVAERRRDEITRAASLTTRDQ